MPITRRPSAAIVRRRRLSFLAGVLAILSVMVLALVCGGSGSRRAARADARAARRSRGTASSARQSSLLAREEDAITRVADRYRFVASGGEERREIALTFDDGPGPYTPRLLDELEHMRVPATFFEIGFMIRYFYDSTERETALGDTIGDHTETHPFMGHLTLAEQRAELLGQAEQLHRHRARFPRLFRPPYGSFDPGTFRLLHEMKMLMVLWTVDTEDYKQPGVQSIVHTALSGARPGAIILMHDAGGTRTQTIEALPIIVHALRSRGYRLVTVPQLMLEDPPVGRPQPPPYGLAGD